MNISELVQKAHENAKAKGWHDKPATFGDRIALIHSELSEALEFYRSHTNWSYEGTEPIYRSALTGCLTREASHWGRVGRETVSDMSDILAIRELYGKIPNKPEGVASELADVVIRVADMCGLYGIDLEKAITEKMAYNETRPYRHGGKAL